MLENTDEIKNDSSTSERSAAEIRQNIAAEKEMIADTVHRLGRRIDESLDWKSQVSKRPVLFLGIAAGVGLIMSKALVSKPTPIEQIANVVQRLPLQQNKEQSLLKMTLFGFITKAAVNWVKENTLFPNSSSGRLLS
jgi:hypothetical protein